MLVYKNFFLKTRTGKLLKRVREHYLRDDISCGLKECLDCSITEDVLENTNHSLLNIKNTKLHSNEFNFNHFLIIDTNIALNQIDVLEDHGLNNIIILQTVFKEVQHCSKTIHERLVEIMSNQDRHFYHFENEFNKETYLERDALETSNDYNDRLIRQATKWYQDHLSSLNYHIVLITDDEQNKKLALDNGLNAISMFNYIESLKNSETRLRLLEKFNRTNISYKDVNQGKCLYPRYYTNSEIYEGTKNGKLHQGTFYVNRYNYLEGSVTLHGQDKSILIKGLKNQNRAVDGDHVVVKLLPKHKWALPSDLILEDTQINDIDVLEDEQDIETSEKQDQCKKSKNKKIKGDEIQITGRIVGITKRNWRPYCGILEVSKYGGNRHLFVPAERRIPKIRIESRQGDMLMSQKIVVVIDDWPRTSRYPNGHFVRALGQIGDKETETTLLLLEHDVPHTNFSKKVEACLPNLPWIITEEDQNNREDIRHLFVCSVDPPGCTDIDDALHCRQLSNGNYEVGVHIADVSHFIRPNTALDNEAALRGNTVYLVGKRIDMVPELLSSNLCSLRDDGDRFAFSCVWEMTTDANIVNTKFHKSIIRSKMSFTYEQAQMAIDDKDRNDQLAQSLRQLNSLAKILKKRRLDNGALVLSSPEVRFHMDSETHEPLEVQVKKICETNSMVEEFMLLANISVAEKIFEDFPEFAILRRHPEPPANNFQPLLKAAKQHNFELDCSSNKTLADSLDNAAKDNNPYFNTMLRILATRCMLQAVYFASGTCSKKDFYHYGLAVPLYTHFTSPIRRYSDILVHRLLAVSIGADITYSKLLDKMALQKCCDNLNYRHRMAQYAGRASAALTSHIFFKGRCTIEDGYILYVRKNALQVLIPKYGLEGTIFLEPPSNQKYDEKIYPKFTYNEDDETQKYGDLIIRCFEPVKVQLQLDSKNIQHEKLVFTMIEPIQIGPIKIQSNENDDDKEDNLMDVDELKENLDIIEIVDDDQIETPSNNEVKSKGKKRKKKNK